ncbi:MAG: NnrU family protein [Betaproteobacteria bacterium]|nr:NnrU family protein [Betaproteobacteria bacterium]
MTLLIFGLILFLGIHSVRIVADGWRAARIAQLGEHGWKGLFSLASALGLGLIVWGYGMARAEPVALWAPPGWTKHVAALLTLPAFILIAAAYVPGSRIKAAVGHPMVAGVKVWAIAHLLSNGNLADVLLFGAFLAWAVIDFRSARQRDRAAGVSYRPGTAARDGLVAAAGIGAWALFAGFLHLWLIGVRPY